MHMCGLKAGVVKMRLNHPKHEYSPEVIKGLIHLREFIEIKNPNAASGIAKSLIKGISQ
jgi:hypothetical protein